jgi:hypothetical protein
MKKYLLVTVMKNSSYVLLTNKLTTSKNLRFTAIIFPRLLFEEHLLYSKTIASLC